MLSPLVNLADGTVIMVDLGRLPSWLTYRPFVFAESYAKADHYCELKNQGQPVEPLSAPSKLLEQEGAPQRGLLPIERRCTARPA